MCLAANDGDRAAWEAWLQPALRQNPDIYALNDSGGQRFQSIDAKLSIALSNVISQAGDVARHVAIKLRLSEDPGQQSESNLCYGARDSCHDSGTFQDTRSA